MAEIVQVKGLRELQAAMLELPKRLDRRILNAALMAGGREMVKEAKTRAPVLTGALRFAVRAVPVKLANHSATVIVGIGGAKQVERTNSKGKKRTVWVRAKKFVFYWLFQEFGTSHQPARPFLRPTFELKKVQAVELFRQRLGERIQAEAQKLRNRA